MPTIETALLSLESVLLMATIILLIYSIKEGESRESLLKEMIKTTKILSREDYFTTVIAAFQESEKEVFGEITGRTPSIEDRELIEAIILQIKRLTKAGISIRYMIPKFPDRLNVGYRYTKAGADVRYSSHLFLNDHRSMVVDDKIVIFGVPEAVGEKEPTKKGFRIPSEGLATILKEHYTTSWEDSTPYDEYFKEVLEQTEGSAEFLAREFEIEEAEIDRILNQ